MARTLIIDIMGLDWYIESTLKGDEGMDKAFPMVANYSLVDGQIAHLHSYTLPDKLLKSCNDYGKEFLERCSFVYVPRDDNGEPAQKDGKVIDGDFIDALVFIYKELEKKAKNG